MRRTTVLGVGLLVAAALLAGWKLSQPAPERSDDEAHAPDEEGQPRRRSKWFWEGDEAPSADEPVAEPAKPRARTLRVSTEQGDPLVNVKVSLLESAVLSKLKGHEPEDCDDHAHLTELAAELRSAGAHVSPLAEGLTDAEGAVQFPERAWPPGLIVRVEVPGRGPWAMRDYGSDEVLVPDFSGGQMRLQVMTSNGEPKGGARVTVADLAGGRVFESRTDGSGLAVIESGFHGFVIVEAEGLLASAVGVLPSSEREQPILLFRPGTVNLTADPKLARFEVSLSVRHPRRTTVIDGAGKFENVRPGSVSVNVSTTGLLGSAQGDLPEDPGQVTLHLPIKRTSQVFVTVVTEAGLPVPEATASLSTPSERVESTATEEGQRLALGPVGEGPAVLRVTAPGFRARTQSLELGPGESDLEVVLSEAPRLRGRVVDGTGAPVAEASVQVRDEAVNQPEGSVTGPDGQFELHVDEEGTWQVEAIGATGEVGRVAAVVPGPEITIQLEPLGGASITVLDARRRPATNARVMIASAESSEPDLGEVPDTGVLEFTELVPGLYRYEVDDGVGGEAFLPQKGEFTVRSGEQTTVTVQTREGATLTGRLVDPDGSPVPYAAITRTGDRSGVAETDEKGEFSFVGLEPGVELELTLDHPEFGALTPAKVRPSTGRVTFKASVGPRVVGRVVDEKGAPVVDFVINGREISDDKGAFDVPASTGVLTISDFEGAEARVEPKGRADVGEVVLRRGVIVTGVVMDEQRRPLPSVEIRCDDFIVSEVMTDASGRFEGQLSRPAESIRLEAKLGEQGTIETVRVSQAPIELTLRPPTRVDGVVRGPGGRPVTTTVVITDPTGEELHVDTDPQGQFSVALAAGRWVFGTRAFRTSSVVFVSGRSQRVELGASAESCEVRVLSAPLPTAVLIVPAGVEANVPSEFFSDVSTELSPGAIALGSDGAAFVGRGLPCGAVSVHAAYGMEMVETKATLRAGPNVVTLSAPSLMQGDTFGYRVPHPPMERPTVELIE
ncbi:MAG: carboxypeptidase-like regulatory domain-containing protein [Myxococcaceae bacterium]|nr:carboxypeptidase-like regulatory domain-containing protein [Myxococcaceae bacterium]